MKNKREISINPWSIALFTLIPLALYLSWMIKDIFFSLLIAFILMSSLRPPVKYLVSKKIPKPLSIAIVFISFILFFTVLIAFVLPPIITEMTSLIKNFPLILDSATPIFGDLSKEFNINNVLSTFSNNLFGFVSAVFSNALFLMSTLFFSIYFLIENGIDYKTLKKYLPDQRAQEISRILHKAETRMSSWFWGELTLMTIIGLATYIGLTIIGIKYALPLAILAGLLEVVPNIGPVLSAIPSVLIGFSMSYFTGISAVALYIIVQQLENNFIVPIIMRRAVGLSPVMTLLALLIGGRAGGILGALLAIPILLIIETVFQEYLGKGKGEKTSKT